MAEEGGKGNLDIRMSRSRKKMMIGLKLKRLLILADKIQE